MPDWSPDEPPTVPQTPDGKKKSGCWLIYSVVVLLPGELPPAQDRLTGEDPDPVVRFAPTWPAAPHADSDDPEKTP
jgi:hypothetical protein